MKIVNEFREFAVKGNAVDMAIGIVVGAAFGKIVTSLVNDVIMPPVGVLLGNVDFAKLQFVLRRAIIDPVSKEIIKPESTLRYGLFINNVVDFIIVAFCLFLVVKAINHLRRRQEAAEKKA